MVRSKYESGGGGARTRVRVEHRRSTSSGAWAAGWSVFSRCVRVRLREAMAPVSSQRLVPIRPSPLKGVATTKTITVITPVSVSATTINSVNSSAKRKLCAEAINSKTKKVNTGSSQQITTMGKRNARERSRVKQVNNSFLTLRQHIPGAAKAKKISKVETLKKAVDYIKHLSQILEEHENSITIRTSQSISNNISVNSPLTTVLTSQFTEITSEYTNAQQPVQTITVSSASKVYSDQPHLVFPSYYYNENISPVSANDYPLNNQPSENNHKSQISFKPESEFKSEPTLSFDLDSSLTPSYSDVSAPVTPVSQVSFILQQSQPITPFSISTPVYQTADSFNPVVAQSPISTASFPTSAATHSPNSLIIHSPSAATVYPSVLNHSQDSLIMHSPNSSAMYSPNSLPASPTCSPSATSNVDFTPTFEEVYHSNSDPSFIKARDFIIPPSELQYCLTPGMISIDIDKATATTKADLDLLDAIHLWQQS